MREGDELVNIDMTVKVEFKQNKIFRFLALRFAGIGLKKVSKYFIGKWIKSFKVRVDNGQWKPAGIGANIEFE